MATTSATDGQKNLELYYMAIALLAERRSKDPVRQVGACIVNELEGNNKIGEEGRVVGIGYNGMPLNCRDELMPWKKSPKTKKKLKEFYVVHAEANAIVNMNPQSVAGCTVYVTLHPCYDCAKNLVLSGISKVRYLSFDNYYKKNNPSFNDSEEFLEKRMEESQNDDNEKFEYDQYQFGLQTEKMILEIQFKSDTGTPRRNGKHSIWLGNEELHSRKYKPRYKYIGKKIEILEKDVKLLEENSIKLEECKQELDDCKIKWKEIGEWKHISWEQYYMGMAIITGDLRGSEAHEGACVVNEDGRIIGFGYYRNIGQIGDQNEEQKLDVHAPVSAIVNRNPVSMRDCTLYVTRFPCYKCAKVIVQAGIKTVVYLDREDTENKKSGEVNAGSKNPEVSPEQQDKLNGKNATEKMFDLAKVKCVSYSECYDTRPVILDFYESNL